MKFHIIYILFIIIGMSSCSDYLDVVPKGKIIPQLTKDYRMLMDQTQSGGQSKGFDGAYSNDLFLSDDVSINSFSLSMYRAPEQNQIRFSEHIFLDNESDQDWETLYNNIYVCNLVVDQVLNAGGGTDAEKKEIQAEARVQRAFAYLTLVNLYGPAYNPNTAAQDLGVPLRMGIDFEEQLARVSVQDIYNFVLSELHTALLSLQATPNGRLKHRPSKAATEALLARVYLYMGDYEKALDHASNSLDYYDQLIDYNNLPASNIFVGNKQKPIGIDNPEVLLLKSPLSPSSLFYVNNDLISQFDSDDLRLNTNFASDAIFGLNFGYISTMWTGALPQKGPTTAEVILIRAECNARLNNPSEAMDDLNLLRSYRYSTGSNYTLSTTDPSQALKYVKNERQKELAFMGLRLFDIKRYNLVDQSQIGLANNVDGSVIELPYDSPRWILPIARKYISLNPEIKQNPR